jgi:hypothetical protein
LRGMKLFLKLKIVAQGFGVDCSMVGVRRTRWSSCVPARKSSMLSASSSGTRGTDREART